MRGQEGRNERSAMRRRRLHSYLNIMIVGTIIALFVGVASASPMSYCVRCRTDARIKLSYACMQWRTCRRLLTSRWFLTSSIY